MAIETINKGELIDVIRNANPSYTKKAIDEILTATLDAIAINVAQGKKVLLVGFGNFEPAHRKARVGRNPKTQEEIQIPEATVPVFHAGKEFKRLVGDQ